MIFISSAGSEMVRWNESSRLASDGISVGCSGCAEVLRIPKDFDRIFHFGVSCELYRMEVGSKLKIFGHFYRYFAANNVVRSIRLYLSGFQTKSNVEMYIL